MQFEREKQFLVVRESERCSRYRLPSFAVLFSLAISFVLLIAWSNPTATALLSQSVGSGDTSRALLASKIAFSNLLDEAENIALREHPPLESQLTTYHLELPNNTLQEMLVAIEAGDPSLNHEAGGNKPYRKAVLNRNGQAMEVKICLRGTMHWHHRPGKPSFRIKLRKQDTAQEDRFIELTTPEDPLALNNLLPMQLASDLDLMTDGSKHVRVFINGKYFGVYVETRRQGEPFALANNRMPGTFFKAEFSEQMWNEATAWKIDGEAAPEDVAAFQSWLELLKSEPNWENIQAFKRVFDCEKFARWSALMCVVGSIHTDDRHNHSYFFCANQGKIEPLVWDCNAYGLHLSPNAPINVLVQPVARFLSHDPSWISERNSWIYRLINGYASTDIQQKRIAKLVSHMRKDLAADRHLGSLKKFTGIGWKWINTSVADISAERSNLIDWIDARCKYLRAQLETAELKSVHRTADSFTIALGGNVAVEAENHLTGQRRLLFPGLASERSLHISEVQQAPIFVKYLEPTPIRYQLSGSPNDWSFYNSLSHELIEFGFRDDQATSSHSEKLAATRTLAEPQPEQLVQNIEIGPGVVTLEQDLFINEQSSLTVNAGTELRLEAGVSILSRGPVRFLGTIDAPIRVIEASASPWGCIGVSGEQTGGTKFEYCEISGGSIGKLDHLRFKGMLSVYDCPQVSLRNCAIGKNYIGDDAVNLAESTIVVENCSWHDAKADALDLDFCSGEVRNCLWSASGNDGLDMMASDIRAESLVIRGSGDKGISVGENSRLHASRIHISECLIGSEIKDDSFALFDASQVSNCDQGIHCYQKKWFYKGGGRVALRDCSIEGCDSEALLIRKSCRAYLVRTECKYAPSNRIKADARDANDFEDMLLPTRYGSELTQETAE